MEERIAGRNSSKEMWKMLQGSSRYKSYAGIIITIVIAFVSILMGTMFFSASMNQERISKSKVALSSNVPLQGFYDSCAPEKGSICYDRLKQMANAGFTLVLNYDQFSGNAEQQLAYGNKAA